MELLLLIQNSGSEIDLYIGNQELGSADFDNNILDFSKVGGLFSYHMKSVNNGAPSGYEL